MHHIVPAFYNVRKKFYVLKQKQERGYFVVVYRLDVRPHIITVCQGRIEEHAAVEQEMAEIVRETVVHELGHYFGLDDETMHRIEDGEE